MGEYLHDRMERIESKLDLLIMGIEALTQMLCEDEPCENDLDGEATDGERDESQPL